MNAVRTGRKPAGPQIGQRLEGSPTAKQRLEVILETIAGQLTVPQACQRLGITIGPQERQRIRLHRPRYWRPACRMGYTAPS